MIVQAQWDERLDRLEEREEREERETPSTIPNMVINTRATWS